MKTKFAKPVSRPCITHLFLGVGALAVLCLLAGCMVRQVAAPVVPRELPPVAPVAPTALTDEAKSVLAAAEQRVRNAEITRTLWSSAKQKLIAAQEAAKKFDSAQTLVLAKEVITLCERSTAQAQLPAVTW
jgi:hypothetical protein